MKILHKNGNSSILMEAPEAALAVPQEEAVSPTQAEVAPEASKKLSQSTEPRIHRIRLENSKISF